MNDTALITFPLDNGLGQSGQSLVYRPFSTRTLKIRVTTTEQEALPALRLRPKRTADKAATQITAGYADQDEAFIVSWGGGHEDGPCIKASDQGHIEGCVPLAAGETSNIFLNLTHIGPGEPETAELTLEAYDETDNSVKASLILSLEKPPGAPEAGDLLRLVKTGDDSWEIGPGRHLPVYDPRWWPHKTVTYNELTDAPPIKIRQDDNKLLVMWDDQDDPIIVLTDQTKPSILTADPALFEPGGFNFELFDWSEDYFVLRIWFSWLNLKVPHNVILLLKRINHEVPDSERFDFLIRKKNGRVPLACTDLHWRELWGWRELKELLQDPEKKTVEAFLGLALNVARPLAIVEATERLVKGPKLHYSILLGFIQRQAEDFAQQDDEGLRTDLGPGDEAHVPALANLDMGPTLTSRDVRYEE